MASAATATPLTEHWQLATSGRESNTKMVEAAIAMLQTTWGLRAWYDKPVRACGAHAGHIKRKYGRERGARQAEERGIVAASPMGDGPDGTSPSSASWNSRVPIMEITRALGIQPTMTWSPGEKVRNTRLVHILSSWRWACDEWDAAPFGSETNGA